jgi:hypothetical protein
MISLIVQFDVNPRWIEQKIIDFSKLDPNFRPYDQREKDCFKKAAIHKGRDSMTGRSVLDTT